MANREAAILWQMLWSWSGRTRRCGEMRFLQVRIKIHLESDHDMAKLFSKTILVMYTIVYKSGDDLAQRCLVGLAPPRAPTMIDDPRTQSQNESQLIPLKATPSEIRLAWEGDSDWDNRLAKGLWKDWLRGGETTAEGSWAAVVVLTPTGSVGAGETVGIASTIMKYRAVKTIPQRRMCAACAIQTCIDETI
ncbi:hypothetical protein DFH29DRAFT_1070893 [Suillus ampliporus]|nr:hypothetical protein DFH29DRAFT_1070893 [Suillus ampliporus]